MRPHTSFPAILRPSTACLASLCIVSLVATVGAAAPGDFVWLEGERPTSWNFETGSGGWDRKELLSEESWLHVRIEAAQVEARCPKEGIVLGYAFEAPSAGEFDIWNRIGFEFARSPFEWRIDEGPWATVRPEDLTTDLVEIGFWCEVAWIRMGAVDLSAGKHSIGIRILPTTKEESGKQVSRDMVYASDVLCLTRGTFRPNGKHRPGADWRTESDRKAADHHFDVTAEAGKPGAPAAPGERIEVPLDGSWEVCRFDEDVVEDRAGPTRTLPDASRAFWSAIQVPGNKFEVKPELRFCHRLVYRTRVRVPETLGDRSFLLRFPEVSLIASVHVNGRFCGWTKAPFALWEVDVTGAIHPGLNEVCVVVKDSYYAFSPKKTGKSPRLYFNIPVAWMGGQNWIGQHFDFPIASPDYGAKSGILATPSIIVAGPTYSADVFVRPSVSRGELAVDVSLRNPGPIERPVEVTADVVPADVPIAEEGAPVKSLDPEAATLGPGEERILGLGGRWENPRLWWPDDPYLYRLVTTVRVDGRPVDVRRTTFGFREWEWGGRQFRINGVPWQLFADTTSLDGGRDPAATVREWKRNHQNLWRFWGRRFGGLEPPAALDLMDAEGIVVRRSGIFDGQGANYLHALANGRELFDNWIVQLEAQVREERNHPSILVWSLENEITFINSRNLGLSRLVEPEIARGARAIQALDPTRPVMVDGGNCLVDETLPVNGVHYQEAAWRDYPDEAYSLEKAYVAHERPVLGWGKIPWRLVPDRPIFMGESFFARGSPPGAYSQLGGEACFEGWGEATRIGVGRLAKMLAEGYRWHGVAAQHFWLGSGDTDLHHGSWSPVCILCREWNWTFGGGEEVSRTLKAFNNTHSAEPIVATWDFSLDGKRVAGESLPLRLAPGGSEEIRLSFRVPRVSRRTAGEFTLACSRGGKEVFRETKPVAAIDPEAGPRPAAGKEALVVLDPHGSAKARLARRGIAFTEVARADDIPPRAEVVVVGMDALDPREATDPRWVALASRGTRILFLEQSYPLHHLAVPADLAPTDFVGRVAFAEDLGHPAFEGLDQPDLFTWSGGHVVYRNAYRKATRGAISLVQCDEGLACSALAACPVNDGLLLLSQLVVGEKLATDPVARRLFDNLLAFADGYRPVRKSTAVVMADGPAYRLIADSGLQFTRDANVLDAIAERRGEIVILDASPPNLELLAGAPERVKAFTGAGGWLVAWGLSPEGLADFNRVVGVDHVLRPFEMERVTLATPRDPLAAGITIRDVTMESGERIFPWSGDRYLVDDAFTWIVDLDDIAPFSEFPGAKAGDGEAARAAVANWPRNAVNGFTSADAWKLIHYLPTAAPRLALRFPREETVERFSIVLNTHYAIPTEVRLRFDDGTDPVVLATRPNGERQDFDVTPRSATRLAIELARFDKSSPTTGIDNLWIRVRRSPEWRSRVKPLLNIGGIVRYPMGPGGLVLVQIAPKDREPVPENLQKKRAIVAALLRNLRATFAGGQILTAANLEFRPLPMEEHCNAYLTADRGWFEGDRDLGHVPRGDVRLGGVRYVIRDFKTSPVPSCVMLAGPGARGALPEEVRGLRAGGRADVLYFLHTFHRVAEWRPRKPGDAPPVLFRYIVHFADGETSEVPVALGEGVDHWISRKPVGLESASVAWAAPFPGDSTGEQAVLYALPWTNPRPDVEIIAIDLAYGTEGNAFGTPALLAITAGTRARN